MARIRQSGETSVYQIKQFLGLNENKDGETRLKLGEAAEMWNWRVTNTGALQVRPGTETMITLDGPILGMWSGNIKGKVYTVCATPTSIWNVELGDETVARKIYSDASFGSATFFGYSNKLYVLAGNEYLVWEAENELSGSAVITYLDDEDEAQTEEATFNGKSYTMENAAKQIVSVLLDSEEFETFSFNRQTREITFLDSFTDVQGYVPTLLIDCKPTGAGTEFEQMNVLTAKRKVKFSPTETATEYVLPEKNLESIDSVRDLRIDDDILWVGEITTETELNITCPTPASLIAYLLTNKEDGLYKEGTIAFAYNTDKWQIDLETPKDVVPADVGLSITGTPADGDTFDVEIIPSWSADLENGTLTFVSAPVAGTNCLEVSYTASEENRSTVEKMRFYEFFNGTNENRVFLYGDGTNSCIYSGIDINGKPTAEYFPALNVLNVGESNTPITGMVRHYSRLVCYKTNSTYSINYEAITLEDGRATAGFYVVPVNRVIGNIAPGQVVIITNNPITLHGGTIYEWRSNSSYNGNLTYDERQARVVSENIDTTLREFDLAQCYCFDDDYNEECYIVYKNSALVYNYRHGCWYKYTEFPVAAMDSYNNEIYVGCHDGTIRHLSRECRYDDYGVGRYNRTTGSVEEHESVTVEIDDEVFLNAIGDIITATAVYDGAQWTLQSDSRIHPIQPTSTYDLDTWGIKLTVNDSPFTPTAGTTLNLVGKNPKPIKAFWRSGSLAFDRDWKKKYSSDIWVALLPENGARVVVTTRSDRKADYPEKLIGYSLISFARVNFSHFSFGTNRRSQIEHVKLKVKKFVYYQLCFEFNCSELETDEPSITSTATIVGADIQVRYAGNVK